MKLFLNKISPYARVVRITAIEGGLLNRIKLEWYEKTSQQESFLPTTFE